MDYWGCQVLCKSFNLTTWRSFYFIGCIFVLFKYTPSSHLTDHSEYFSCNTMQCTKVYKYIIFQIECTDVIYSLLTVHWSTLNIWMKATTVNLVFFLRSIQVYIIEAALWEQIFLRSGILHNWSWELIFLRSGILHNWSSPLRTNIPEKWKSALLKQPFENKYSCEV